MFVEPKPVPGVFQDEGDNGYKMRNKNKYYNNLETLNDLQEPLTYEKKRNRRTLRSSLWVMADVVFVVE
jgi:hypothetical protein